MKRFAIGLIGLIWMIAAAAPAWAAPDVALSVRAANEGRVRPGGWLTVIADLTNAGPEVEGRLVVVGDDSGWGAAVEYAVPLTLPAGGRKRVPVTLPTYGTQPVSVRFEVDGQRVASETVPVVGIGRQQALIGVLSEDELGVPGLSRIATGQDGIPPAVVRLDAQTLPARAALLESYSIIALSRFDSGTLSPEQLRALEVWVGKGGTLLLTGGPEWKRTLEPLPSALVPVAVDEVREVDLRPLGEAAGRPLSAGGPVSVARLLKGHVLIQSGDVPLLTTTPVGAGRVLFLAVDPALEPVVTWQGQSALFTRYMGLAPGSGTWEWDNREYEFHNALQRIEGLGLPSLWLVFGLLAGYLLLVGPANYLLLKRLDKREWSWVTVPALSFLFAGVVWAVTAGSRTSLISHVITVTELVPGTETATMTSYIGVYAPTRQRLEIPLTDARLVKPLRVGMPGAQGEVTSRVVLGERTRVELLNLTNYAMRSVAVERDVAVPGGGLELVDVELETDRLRARLVNRLERRLSDVRLAYGQSQVTVGDLGPGETSEPFVLPLRAGAALGGPRINDIWQSGPDLEAHRRAAVIRGVYGWGAETFPRHVIVVTGWADGPPADPAVPELGTVFTGTHLVHMELPVPTDASRGDLPPGVVVGVVTEGDGWGHTPQGLVIHRGSVTFSLFLPPLDPERVAEVTFHQQSFGGGTWSVSVKNQRTGEWEPLTTAVAQRLNNWQELIAPGGLLEVRYDVTNHLEMGPPTVSVKGVER